MSDGKILNEGLNLLSGENLRCEIEIAVSEMEPGLNLRPVARPGHWVSWIDRLFWCRVCY